MFGESDSESPRVPSPWDSLTSAPSPPPTQIIPKLVPEAEEGNVEYKLQLLSPSPARFARLVTQLKWRLLEGGGQAYYELGVADSGTLVGLPRQQLEESLETLEMMAGEIGASVIVVKEIEVPLELSSFAESQLERWDSKKSIRRKDMLRMRNRNDESPITSATETDYTDAEEVTCYSPVTSLPSSLEGESDLAHLKLPSLPSTFDSTLAMFTMDAREDVADYADNEAQDDDIQPGYPPEFSVNLEISTVYKPRPMKKRVTHVTDFDRRKRRLRNGHPPSKSTETTGHTEASTVQDNSQAFLPSCEFKSQLPRDKRDSRRELKFNTPLSQVSTCSTTKPPPDTDHLTIHSYSVDIAVSFAPESPLAAVTEPVLADVPRVTTTTSKEPRLIVEVLVVRKLSLDEAFLDFEGFSLQ